MKTAEDWNDILDEKYRNGERQTDADQVTVIKQIQLDAYRAGGLAAADISLHVKHETLAHQIGGDNITRVILTHFNNPQMEIPG